MTTNARNLANLLGSKTTISSESLPLDVPFGPGAYATVEDLPLFNNLVGDQAFVRSTNRLYIWSGDGWYSVALINTSPAFDSGGSPNPSYILDSNGGTPTIIQLNATDPEGLPIQWSYVASDSAQYFADITNDSSVFTITAKPTSVIEQYSSSGGSFAITFKASDGVNLATALSEFSVILSVPTAGVLYSTPGTYSWTCPEGVTSVSVIAIGGGGGGGGTLGFPGNVSPRSAGGGGGGGLGWKNSISVFPGQSYTVVVGEAGLGRSSLSTGLDGGDSYFIDSSTVAGFGGQGGHNGWNNNYTSYANPYTATGGGYVGDGGGTGGTGSQGGLTYDLSTSGAAGGGGGAGGYTGNGGAGSQNGSASAGSGGGGGGGAAPVPNTIGIAGNGGGVGIYGEGASGAGGTSSGSAYSGKSGSGATDPLYGDGTTGGIYGGGGGGANCVSNNTKKGNDGASGSVRIIWGAAREFPTTNVDLASSTDGETTI